jgi:hypothetical protein
MPLLIPVSSPKGELLSFHKITRVVIEPENGTATITVASWLDEADYMQPCPGRWVWSVHPVPAGVDTGQLDRYLAESPGVFYGGMPVMDPAQSISSAKEFLWARIKQRRAEEICRPISVEGMVFDADQSSQSNILRCVILLQTMQSMGVSNPTVQYTLWDNTVVPLGLPELVAAGMQLGQRETAVRGIATQIREQILAATSLAELEGIQWPDSTSIGGNDV